MLIERGGLRDETNVLESCEDSLLYTKFIKVRASLGNHIVDDGPIDRGLLGGDEVDWSVRHGLAATDRRQESEETHDHSVRHVWCLVRG